MIAATFDRSRLLPLYARIGEVGVPLILTFLDANGDPFSILGIDWKLNVKRKASDTTNVFELILGDGLTIQGASNHQLKVELSAERSAQRDETHFYRLYDYEELHTWLNGPFRFHNGEFDGVEDTDTLTVTFDSTVVTIEVTTDSGSVTPPAWGDITGTLANQTDLETALNLKANSSSVPSAATQSQVDTGTDTATFVNPATLAGKALKSGTYSTTLTFDTDKDIYHDATGESITFTLGLNGVNGVGIILRLNKPTAVSFPGTFEADANSVTLDATKLNVYTLVFFTNWNGSGLDHVIYSNHLFTAQ